MGFIQKSEVSKNLSPLTLKAYISDLADYMRLFEGDISNQALINYIDRLKCVRKLKDTSVKRKLVTLNLFIDYLIDESILEDNPIRKLKIHFKKEKRLPKTLSIKEVTALLKAIDVNLEKEALLNITWTLF